MAFSRSLVLPSMRRQNWWDTCDYPSSLLDQHFEMGLLDSDLCVPTLYRGFVLRPRSQASLETSGHSEVKNEKDKFQVMLNVSHFKPEQIEVKIVDDYVVIHGKHEEKTDVHGFVQREFTRRYPLPENIIQEQVISSLSPNGVLTIEAPKIAIEQPQNERVIQVTIQQPEGGESK